MIAQLLIALFGLTSAWLVYDANPKRRKWAPLLSLIAQPAWYWSCIEAQQWGVLALTVFYTILHFRGFWKQWIVKPSHAFPARAIRVDTPTQLKFRNCCEATCLARSGWCEGTCGGERGWSKREALKISAGGLPIAHCRICDEPGCPDHGL